MSDITYETTYETTVAGYQSQLDKLLADLDRNWELYNEYHQLFLKQQISQRHHDRAMKVLHRWQEKLDHQLDDIQWKLEDYELSYQYNQVDQFLANNPEAHH